MEAGEGPRAEVVAAGEDERREKASGTLRRPWVWENIAIIFKKETTVKERK
jgi:hypothetical protein